VHYKRLRACVHLPAATPALCRPIIVAGGVLALGVLWEDCGRGMLVRQGRKADGSATIEGKLVMPKMSDREKLADLAAKCRKIAEEIEATRQRMRERYSAIVTALPVETYSEREFREAMGLLVKLDASTAIAALKTAAPRP